MTPALANLLERLRATLGTDNVIVDEAGQAPHLVDWRRRYRGRALCVAKPASTTEVAAVVAACAAAGVGIVPQGGNTGLVGGATPDQSGSQVVLNLARLRQVRELDLANNTVTVEAGCLLAEIRRLAEDNGRLFPLSLAAEGSCQIGGNLSTNAGGVHVVRYGNARELTLGLEVVLPNAEVWDGLRALRKDNTGYDLKQLFIGAEGTLGVITAAVLKLFPLPTQRVVGWIGLPDVAAAVGLFDQLRALYDDRLSALELIGRQALDLVLEHIPRTRDPLDRPWPWSVLVELADTSPHTSLADNLAVVIEQAMADGTVGDAVLAQDLEQANALWRLRESVSEAERAEGISIKHDVAVPVSRAAQFLAAADAAVAKRFGHTRIVAFGHLGDGNLHYNLSRCAGDENTDLIALSEEANRIIHDIVASLGGTISAEHGLGQLKREEVKRYKSAVELYLMTRVKAALDPQGLMNPGKLL